ncbi:MAG: DUF1152 domain-containing protein [Myxococcales bacterium]
MVLVDGGTDILMRGDEAGLGTPVEDITSLSAVHGLGLGESIVACLGFGVDAFHGVCHAHFLENVAALSKEKGYLGVAALLPEMPEVEALPPGGGLRLLPDATQPEHRRPVDHLGRRRRVRRRPPHPADRGQRALGSTR